MNDVGLVIKLLFGLQRHWWKIPRMLGDVSGSVSIGCYMRFTYRQHVGRVHACWPRSGRCPVTLAHGHNRTPLPIDHHMARWPVLQSPDNGLHCSSVSSTQPGVGHHGGRTARTIGTNRTTREYPPRAPCVLGSTMDGLAESSDVAGGYAGFWHTQSAHVWPAHDDPRRRPATGDPAQTPLSPTVSSEEL